MLQSADERFKGGELLIPNGPGREGIDGDLLQETQR